MSKKESVTEVKSATEDLTKKIEALKENRKAKAEKINKMKAEEEELLKEIDALEKEKAELTYFKDLAKALAKAVLEVESESYNFEERARGKSGTWEEKEEETLDEYFEFSPDRLSFIFDDFSNKTDTYKKFKITIENLMQE